MRGINHKAFTVLELVFIIMIMGVLAAVAIPKFSATRDDAWVSTIAQNTMTSAFEIATYAASKGQTERMLSEMSNALRQMKQDGIVSESAEHTASVAAEKGGEPCLTLTIENGGGATETLRIALLSSEDQRCGRLQQLIDAAAFPMPLRGSMVVY